MDQTTLNTWTLEQYKTFVDNLIAAKALSCIKVRDEYTLLLSVIGPEIFRATSDCQKIDNKIILDGAKNNIDGVNLVSPMQNTEFTPNSNLRVMSNTTRHKPFLMPFDRSLNDSIGSEINSFKIVRSDALCINIGFDTEFVYANRSSDEKCTEVNRRVLSFQASIQIGDTLVRYFFVVNPQFQDITKDGGKIPITLVISDILNNLREFFPDLPKIHRSKVVRNEIKGELVVDYKSKEMKAITIPVCLVCHAGKADISVFRREKRDINLFSNLSEIQGGWCTIKSKYCRVPADRNGDYYYILDFTIRDTLSLTPDETKSLKVLGSVIKQEKVELPSGAIENMSSFAIENPSYFYDYAMNDADIVVRFISSLFGCNHKIPITLSSAATKSMVRCMKQYLGVRNQAEFDRVYRGLMMLDEGLVCVERDYLSFCKATRYDSICEDARLFSENCARAYIGGFNTSFKIGWFDITTTDYDLKNAYPTAMANIIDVDWEKPLFDIPREYELTLQNLFSPLTPFVGYIDFEFPTTVYSPCIPVPVDGKNIYPRKGYNVYASGPDIYLALRLGAKVICHRGYIAPILERDDGFSRSLACAVQRLVQDRSLAKKLYPDDPVVEKALKTMVNSCYGKTAQNVSPKTRYNAKIMGRVDSEPSLVTSPYHACYTTALVRDMLMATVNQLHDLGYIVYSATTDGFITNASIDVLRSLDAYGFYKIFQEGRYTLNGNRDNSKENQVWEAKHYNDILLNITTRGNVAINEGGVLAHNSYTTGEVKDSLADREALIIAVLSRVGKIKCKNKIWSRFSDMVEKKCDFSVREIVRQLSMDYDYKRCPLEETFVDEHVHYIASSGYVVDTDIATFDTRPFEDVEEYLNYQRSVKHEKCIKVSADLKRVSEKSTIKSEGYLGSDPQWTILRSIIMGYRCKIYSIPSLDGLKGKERLDKINSWVVSSRQFTADDWKNCGRETLQSKMLSYEYVKETLEKINGTMLDDVGDVGIVES